MDAALLTRYRLRLANLSQRNRALKLGKLSPQRDVDWFDLAYIEDESADKLLDRVVSGKSVAPVKRYYTKIDLFFVDNNVLCGKYVIWQSFL